jgi:hypothetical protein
MRPNILSWVLRIVTAAILLQTLYFKFTGAAVRRALEQVEGQRQSILKRAFEGRLVGHKLEKLKSI